ncbi:MAG: hypothetical protein NVSMB9_37230 [Isosphaeraceae bacterium]
MALMLVLAGFPAQAQFFLGSTGAPGHAENIEGFTVPGKAAIDARPNLLEIDLEVTAASELSADAIVKYRDARRRLRDAFTALKLANVTVEERGLLVDHKGMVNPNYFGGFPQNTRAKTEVQLSRKLVVKGSNIRKLDEDGVLQLVAKLLDVAQDAGGKVGGQNNFNPYQYNPYQNSNSNSLVRFVLDDFDKLQEEAYEKAVADARERAKRLARLSGVELGPIVAIREVAVPGDRASNPTEDESPRKRLETPRFQEIAVRVELLVRFEVRASTAGKGGAGQR